MFLPTVVRGASDCAGRARTLALARVNANRRPEHALHPLKRRAQSDAHRERLDRLEMDVVDGRCLVCQLRGVEIVDLMRAGVVEQVQNVEPEPRTLG